MKKALLVEKLHKCSVVNLNPGLMGSHLVQTLESGYLSQV
jgi:hypothetical protein